MFSRAIDQLHQTMEEGFEASMARLNFMSHQIVTFVIKTIIMYAYKNFYDDEGYWVGTGLVRYTKE